MRNKNKNLNRLFNLLGLTLITTFLLVASCKEEEPEKTPCYVSDPIEELVWLKQMITHLSDYDFIMIANYKGETVFYNGNCNPAANFFSVVYNWQGVLIASTNDVRNDLSNERLLWQSDNPKCNFFD